MKKLLLLATFAFAATSANAGIFGLGEDPCNPTPKCGPEPVECYDCAINQPETLVKLAPCAQKNKPYNYYSYEKVAEKTVASDRYDWNTPSN